MVRGRMVAARGRPHACAALAVATFTFAAILLSGGELVRAEPIAPPPQVQPGAAQSPALGPMEQMKEAVNILSDGLKAAVGDAADVPQPLQPRAPAQLEAGQSLVALREASGNLVKLAESGNAASASDTVNSGSSSLLSNPVAAAERAGRGSGVASPRASAEDPPRPASNALFVGNPAIDSLQHAPPSGVADQRGVSALSDQEKSAGGAAKPPEPLNAKGPAPPSPVKANAFDSSGGIFSDRGDTNEHGANSPAAGFLASPKLTESAAGEVDCDAGDCFNLGTALIDTVEGEACRSLLISGKCPKACMTALQEVAHHAKWPLCATKCRKDIVEGAADRWLELCDVHVETLLEKGKDVVKKIVGEENLSRIGLWSIVETIGVFLVLTVAVAVGYRRGVSVAQRSYRLRMRHARKNSDDHVPLTDSNMRSAV